MGAGWGLGVKTLTGGLCAFCSGTPWGTPAALPLHSPGLTHTLRARLNDGPAGSGAQHPRTGQSGARRRGGGEIISGQ